MTLGAAIWRWRYVAEDRRQRSAGRQKYAREVAWCIALLLLGAGRW
jgi:hypothetical protein